MGTVLAPGGDSYGTAVVRYGVRRFVSAVIRSDVAYMGGGERGKTSEEESRTKEEENVVGRKGKSRCK